jgi:Tol biopolymer transport system component
MRQLTVSGRNAWGIWSPDGRVAFQSDRGGDFSIYVQPTDNSGDAERLTTAGAGVFHRPLSWGRNGHPLRGGEEW